MAVRKTSKTVRKSVSMPSEEIVTDMSTPATSSKPSLFKRLRNPKVFIPLIIIILLVGTAFLKGLFVAALVNGQPITRLSLIQELEEKQGKQALSALVNQVLIMQEAKKKNIEVSKKEIDDSVKQIEDSLKAQGQNLDTALKAQNLSREDFLEQIKLRIIVEKLLADKVKVTDKEINSYIETNKSSFPAEMAEKDIKAGVKQQLEQQKFQTEYQKLLDSIQKNAKINYLVNL